MHDERGVGAAVQEVDKLAGTLVTLEDKLVGSWARGGSNKCTMKRTCGLGLGKGWQMGRHARQACGHEDASMGTPAGWQESEGMFVGKHAGRLEYTSEKTTAHMRVGRLQLCGLCGSGGGGVHVLGGVGQR